MQAGRIPTKLLLYFYKPVGQRITELRVRPKEGECAPSMILLPLTSFSTSVPTAKDEPVRSSIYSDFIPRSSGLRRSRSKSWSGIMAEKFYYVEFKFIPKKERHIHRDAVVEVPKDLVRRELINGNQREKKVALDLARAVALTALSAGAVWIPWPYDEDALWCDDRPSLIGERACDYEENGVRVWRIS
jgi:hypothetical protein